MIIDAHQHFWQLGKHDCHWPTPSEAAIYRDYQPEHLAPLLEKAGVSGTVLVQSQESDTDTDFLLAVADTHSVIKAVVGWVDLASPEAPARIAQLKHYPKLRGLRPMLQSQREDAWILNPQLEPAITAMINTGLRFDALVFTRHLPHLWAFAKRYPSLPIVIDHAAKPSIASDGFSGWYEAMAALAALPQVYCKMSGLVTEAVVGQGVAELGRYTDALLSLFGAERLMWGSDWPVVELAPSRKYASYEGWADLARQLLEGRTAQEMAAIWGKTAQVFYGI